MFVAAAVFYSPLAIKGIMCWRDNQMERDSVITRLQQTQLTPANSVKIYDHMKTLLGFFPRALKIKLH